jgi:hypothetical protein
VFFCSELEGVDAARKRELNSAGRLFCLAASGEEFVRDFEQIALFPLAVGNPHLAD